ncbi:ASCH domain-containing protein [Paraburkholderia sp. BCC1876]|uniref:ASCH domain-containing protein n=1 Tax=Paraburkholderia sp. BCC1876 TaxID=2676303 RepID=UPI00158FD539|nr:ASCH domain-containing protein [Paraburkholderia sp. BCC1876]
MNVLTLRLKAIYFHDIKSGAKPWEYRLATPYWRRRIENRRYDFVLLTLGYPARSNVDLQMLKPWRGYIEQPLLHPHFGPFQVDVFAIDVTAPTVPLEVLHRATTGT